VQQQAAELKRLAGKGDGKGDKTSGPGAAGGAK